MKRLYVFSAIVMALISTLLVMVATINRDILMGVLAWFVPLFVLAVAMPFLKLERMPPVVVFCIIFPIVGVFSGFFVVSVSEDEAGVVYVLGDVTDKQQSKSRKRNRSTEYQMDFSAWITTPTFGLNGKDCVKYYYSDYDNDLDAPFPIYGDKVLMRYPVALPENVTWEILNPDDDILEVCSSPLVVTPEKDTLWGDAAMEYIEEYIKSNE